MGKFQDVQQMLKLRKEAKSVQKKLKNIHIEADDGDITVTIDGEQHVIKVEIKTEGIDPKIKEKIEKMLVEAFNKGIKKSQEIAAANMKDIMSQMGGGIPGM
jgi:DNA-binding YbaB/EbfC family protein